MMRKSAAGVKAKPPVAVIMARGVLYAYIFSIIALFAFSLLLHFTQLAETTTPYVTQAVALVAIFSGAAYVTRRVGSRGWLLGCAVGLIYLIGMFLISLVITQDFDLQTGYIAKVIVASAAGAAGGIYGVNS